MNEDLQFRYALSGPGSAKVVISRQATWTELNPSDVSDALDDFLRAIVTCIESGTSTCTWDEEPTARVWTLHRRGNRISIEIRDYPDVSEIRNHSDPELGLAGKTSFALECNLLAFAQTVAREIDALLNRHGAEGYEREWRAPFPADPLDQLHKCIKFLGETRR